MNRTIPSVTLLWRHNGRDGISNHQPRGCLLNSLFGRTSKKTSKLRVTGLCAGNWPVTGEFPAQMASNAEDVSIWWRPHELGSLIISCLYSKVMVSTLSLLVALIAVTSQGHNGSSNLLHSTVCATVCFTYHQRKCQSFRHVPFVSGNHRWPVVSPNKGPPTRKLFPFHDVIIRGCPSLSLTTKLASWKLACFNSSNLHIMPLLVSLAPYQYITVKYSPIAVNSASTITVHDGSNFDLSKRSPL